MYVLNGNKVRAECDSINAPPISSFQHAAPVWYFFYLSSDGTSSINYGYYDLENGFGEKSKSGSCQLSVSLNLATANFDGHIGRLEAYF